MTIQMQCPTCKCALKIRDELAGRRGKCPKCNAAFVIPGIAVQAAPAQTGPVPAGPPPLPPNSGPPPIPQTSEGIAHQPGPSAIGSRVGADARRRLNRIGRGKSRWVVIAVSVLIAIVVASVIAGSFGKASSMTFDQFRETLAQLGRVEKTYRCDQCNGTGKRLQEFDEPYTCPECKGGTKNKYEKTQAMYKCSVCEGTGKAAWSRSTDGVCPTCDGKGEKLDVCHKCHGDGSLTKKVEKMATCRACSGKGEYKGTAPVTLKEFVAAVGEPWKKQEISGNKTWYYRCRDGIIEIEVKVEDDGTIVWLYPDLH